MKGGLLGNLFFLLRFDEGGFFEILFYLEKDSMPVCRVGREPEGK